MRGLARLVALSIGILSIVGVEAEAALQPQPIVPAFESTGNLLMANRLTNRGVSFRVRSSRYRRGGFSRGSCPEGAAPIVPVPEDNNAAPSYLTASSHPTFLINVPKLPNASGVVYVEDPASNRRNPQLYKAQFTLTDEAGIVGIAMPAEAPALAEGSSYRWRVVINCSPKESEQSTIVFSGGEIQRVANIEGTPEQQFDYYLTQGIWQETAETLAEDRYAQANPDADTEWAVLMEESGLAQYTTTPIVGIINGQLATN